MGRGREREGGREGERECVCACVCTCVHVHVDACERGERGVEQGWIRGRRERESENLQLPGLVLCMCNLQLVYII